MSSDGDKYNFNVNSGIVKTKNTNNDIAKINSGKNTFFFST